MILIFGKLYNIAHGENKDRETGEITVSHTAEILHTARGKTEIASVKLDAAVLEPWTKAVGKDISAEVRFYAMKTREGSIMSGLTLADKKALPTLQAAAPALKAA